MGRGRILLIFLSVSAFAESSVHGIKNFRQVDEHVFRGGQPTAQGFQDLAKNGVKVIIDLREPGSRSVWEENAVTAAGMRYVNVPMTGLTPPSEAEIGKILPLLEDSSIGPVFVHCMRGADRTGAVIASYRIQHDHWENARALKEARADGMSFFQYPRQSYIRNFRPRTVDASAGLQPPATENVGGPTTASAVVAR
jgi:tyrosine-protein phosphatase SIW14